MNNKYQMKGKIDFMLFINICHAKTASKEAKGLIQIKNSLYR